MRVGKFIAIILVLLSSTLVRAQMLVGSDTLTGHEWVRYGQAYYKFTVHADGIYRLDRAAMLAAGIPAGEIRGDQLRLYSLGSEVPVFASTNETFGADDYLEFFGHRNRGELDRHLFRKPDEDMLHPDHSLYTDDRVYYLTTAGDSPPLRPGTWVLNMVDPESYILHEEAIRFAQTLNDPYYPVTGGGSISYSSYMHAEGFASNISNNSTTAVTSPDRHPTGPDAALRIRFATTNYGTHRYIVIFNGQTLDTLQRRDLDFIDTTFLIPHDGLADENTLQLTSINTQSRHALVLVSLTYARQLNTDPGGPVRKVLPAGADAQRWGFSGLTPEAGQPVVYEVSGRYRTLAAWVGPEATFSWPARDSAISVLLMRDADIPYIGQLTEVRFTDLSADDTEYIIITHPALMSAGTESEYVQYRMSPAGGGYKAKAYSIPELYDQFGYGIDKHPQAIRNFIEFAHRHWPSARMVFIVGRGIEYHRSRYAGTGWEQSFFVPTFGRPGSDQLLMATVWDLMPRFPVGRLAVTDAQGVSDYLDKVKAHDQATASDQTLESKRWIKNVMHLGGGQTSSEQRDFEIALKSLGDQLATSGYGANVSFFQKTSTDIIGESQSARILKLLREGNGIINYLGHSGSSTFEFNINDPAEWDNAGRYPVVSAMGCSAGQIHGPLFSLSDNYVQIPGEGAIAFISGSGSQFAAALTAWCRPWYEHIGDTGYGATVGESVLYGLEALAGFINPNLTGSNQYRFLLEQQTFQGDPAIRLHPLPGPDYLLSRSAVQIEPALLSAELDSFDITFSIFNIGRNLRQSVPYRISIRLPSGEETELRRDTILADRFESPMTVRLPLATQGKAGSFRLLIHVDPDNVIAEAPAPAAELNNLLTDNFGQEGLELYVVDNLISAIYPPEYSIVNIPAPVMLAAGSDAFRPGVAVTMEIDTTALFDSPLRQRERIETSASSVSWSPAMDWMPGQVYYWRVSADSLSPEQGFVWDRKSFRYQPGSPEGWNQSHFHQFADDTREQLLVDSLHRTFPFGTKAADFQIVNRFHDYATGLIPRVVLDGIIRAEFFTGFREREVHAFVVAIDSLTGNYMLNPNPGLYGSSNHLSFDARCFAYRTDTPESRQALVNFIEEIIPPGHYVFFYTYQRTPYPTYYPEQWAGDEGVFGKSIFTAIESQFPSSAIRTLETSGSVPYIALFRKDRGGIVELMAADTTEVLSLTPDLQSSLSDGRMTTPLIGPVSGWKQIRWQGDPPESDTSGIHRIMAEAISADFTDTLLISPALPADTTLDQFAAGQYPYIQLSLHTQDTVTYDPMDIRYWQVLYDGIPEFVIRPDLGFFFYADTLLRGDTMRLTATVENITPYAATDVPVTLRLTAADNTTILLTTAIAGLPAHGTAEVSFSLDTRDMSGDYQLVFQVNPGGIVPEMDVRNNVGLLRMHVREDRANPILDVTFDGFVIKDGDLVSSRPEILASLTDDNPRFRLQDTSIFEIYLEFPSDFEAQRIYFSDPRLALLPAPDEGPNVAHARLLPDLTEDGIYTLRVRAMDASGNAAGDADYHISFRVDHREAVSRIYAVPNPFRHSTRFVYSLSGQGTPPDYRIEIVTLAGIKVRDITKAELGPLPAGTHPTSYSWDGTDADGSQLPSGMYLYRMVVTDANGREYPILGAPANSQATGKGWGKLIIIR